MIQPGESADIARTYGFDPFLLTCAKIEDIRVTLDTDNQVTVTSDKVHISGVKPEKIMQFPLSDLTKNNFFGRRRRVSGLVRSISVKPKAIK